MKIICLNNYSLDESQQAQEKKNLGDNHLWGVNYLEEYGITADILPFSGFKFLKKISSMYITGDLDQQLRLIKILLRTKYDYIYTAHQNTIWLSAYLRKIFRFIPPIIAVLHSIPDIRNTVVKNMMLFHLGKIDRIICISRKNYKFLIDEAKFPKDKVFYLDWGVDLGFYKPKKQERKIILSVGKTLRDYRTLCEAVKGLDVECIIVCDRENVPELNCEEYPNVKFITEFISYDSLFDLYNSAIAVVVPLEKVHRKYGITSVLEGLAMARPVIAAQNDYIDVGLEMHGCGLTYKVGNAAALRDDIFSFINNKKHTEERGERGRRLVEKYYDSARFGRELATIIKKM